MKANISDHRVEDTSLKEVYTYPAEEKETILNYDYSKGQWTVWTSVPSHITKLLKLNSGEFEVDSVTDSGTITAIKGTIDKKQISFRNIIELTEEQKQIRRERAKERFNSK